MPDTQHTLTEQALFRLRKLAEGNGLDPQKIELMGADEKTFELEGLLTLTPVCKTQSSRYPGAPSQGRGRVLCGSFAELHEEAQRRNSEFTQSRDWIDGALKELKQAPGEGWGLEGAQITLPGMKPEVLAASEPCPSCQGRKLLTCQQCHGQGSVICPHCQGRRQENCLACGGTGMNPMHPGQTCSICNGTRFTTCRFCRGTGQLTCPTCNGRRGTPCPGCNGSGRIGEDIAIACEIGTSFRMKGENLPSGLRRGLDRLGISNLGKGHADISLVPPPKSEEERAPKAGDEEEKKKAEPHVVHYRALLPYADLRMNFNGKKAVVSAFGKRCALLGVPLFLDAALEPARANLRAAAQGTASLDAALETRIIKEALALELAGQGNAGEMRRIYSVGLSPDVAKEIFRNLHLALNRQTLKLRRGAALVSVALSTLCLGLFFHLGFHAAWTAGLAPKATLALDILLPLPFMALAYLALNASSYLALEKRFKGHKISLHRKPGKTGYGMLAAIFLLYWLMLLTAPEKPVWLLQLLH